MSSAFFDPHQAQPLFFMGPSPSNRFVHSYFKSSPSCHYHRIITIIFIISIIVIFIIIIIIITIFIINVICIVIFVIIVIIISSLSFASLSLSSPSSLGTLSNDNDDGSENVAKKTNLRSIKLNRVYLDPHDV